MRGRAFWLTALTIAAVVCIASSNGGTTSQDLKTGYLSAHAPAPTVEYPDRRLTSALVIGGTMLLLDEAGTHYTNKDMPKVLLPIDPDAPTVHVGRPHESDTKLYRAVHVRDELKEALRKEYDVEVKEGRYLVEDEGKVDDKKETFGPTSLLDRHADRSETQRNGQRRKTSKGIFRSPAAAICLDHQGDSWAGRSNGVCS